MRRLFIAIVVLAFAIQNCQAQNNTINVKVQESFSQSFNRGLQAGAAVRAARAAELANKGESTESVEINTLDMSKYNHVVFVASGWKPKANIKTIKKIMANSALHFYDNTKGKYIYEGEDVLHVKWIREATDNVNRSTIIVAKDDAGNVVFKSKHYNTPYSIMLEPFIVY